MKECYQLILDTIDNIEDVRTETRAWEEFRNNKKAKVNWQFTAKDAQQNSNAFIRH